jgi:HK97 family phage portal protein
VPPQEIQVTEDPRDLRFPVIEWRGRRMRNEDMRQLTLNKLPGNLRGSGPLQLCGAAASVAVESQEWAANFYAEGGVPSIVIKSADELTAQEATDLKTQWNAGGNNVPKVIDPGTESVEQFGVNSEAASMFAARDFQNAEAARMFGVAASLLDIPIGGQSLTYKTLESEFTKFVKTCLWPNYLEPMEQTMSDLLTRSTVCRFNVDAFMRPDTKTRFEVYKLGVESGVMTPEQAAIEEGFTPGDVENAPMPLAMPAAIPSSLPIQGRSQEGPVRCPSCGKSRFVVESLDPPRLRCIRCKALVEDTHARSEVTPPIVIPQQSSPEIHFHEGAFKAGDVHVEAAPAPQVNIHEGAIRSGDVHVPAAEEAVAAAERVDKAADQVENTAERVERMERAYLDALAAMRKEQPDFLGAMRELAEEMKPKPVRQRLVRDADYKIIGVEPWPDDEPAQSR